MFAYPLASKPCSEATNIGDRLSLEADFGCWSKLRTQDFGFVIFAKFLSALGVDLRIRVDMIKF